MMFVFQRAQKAFDEDIVHLWTPRWMQAVKFVWARSRMLPSVRPVLAALWPLACMGVRGPKPDQKIVLEGTLIQPGLFDPVSPTVVPCSPSTAYVPDNLWRSFGAMPPLPPEPCNPPSSSTPPIRSAPSCSPVPQSPACAACAPTCVPARIRALALGDLPARPPRCCR